MLFSDLNLDRNLLRGIEEAGYSVGTPVQEETLTHTLAGRDVSVQSQTGTGKTAAFVISLYQLMLTGEDRSDKALIIAPTRELVMQVKDEARLLGLYLPLNIGAFYGGIGYGKQEEALRNGVDILVATPGRLLDFAQKGAIDLQSIGYLVIDEADRLFDMGFLPDLRRILRRMRPPSRRHTMLFSATLSYTARHLASEHMNNPYEVEIASPRVTVDSVEQELYHVGHVEKLRLLLGLLRREAPRNCLIFVNMKMTAERLAQRLSINGHPCEYLSGDLAQNRRQRTIDRFKNGEIPLLVATDVAARGIHVEELALVVNFDLPEDCEVYVHRIGRTARAGKSGKAISLACENTVAALPGIEKLIGMRIPVIQASDELYAEDVSRGRPSSRHREGPQASGNRTGSRPIRGAGQAQRRRQPHQGQSRGGSGDHADAGRSPEPRNRSRQEYRAGSSPARAPHRELDRTATPRVAEQAPKEHRKSKSLFRRIAGLFGK